MSWDFPRFSFRQDPFASSRTVLLVSGWLGIQKYPTELSGKPVALIGLALNLLLSTIAPARHAYIYATEVPEGFERISFATLKSPMGAPDAPTKEALSLDGKKIFLKDMYTRQA